jgi:hypothetical protein
MITALQGVAVGAGRRPTAVEPCERTTVRARRGLQLTGSPRVPSSQGQLMPFCYSHTNHDSNPNLAR